MSKIRFLHSDYLRLATPVSGISDAPGWLQQLGASCIRQAVRNVIDTAISHEVDFVLIAGGITESPIDLPSSAAWLDSEFDRLRRHGIQTLVNARTDQEAALLQPICDIVVRSGNQIVVSREPGRNVRFRELTHRVESVGEELLVLVDSDSVNTGRTVYRACPSLRPSDECDSVSKNGMLALSAGAVQAVHPSETFDHGCQVIEANTTTRELKSEYVGTDVLRFATEELQLSSAITIDSLTTAVANASNVIGQSASQTVIVDWKVDAALISELSDVARFDEFELLHRLRADVQSGHRGVWPRRIKFTDESSLQLVSVAFESVDEYVELLSDSVRSFGLDEFTERRRMLHNESGVPPELIAGLSLLGRVA